MPLPRLGHTFDAGPLVARIARWQPGAIVLWEVTRLPPELLLALREARLPLVVAPPEASAGPTPDTAGGKAWPGPVGAAALLGSIARLASEGLPQLVVPESGASGDVRSLAAALVDLLPRLAPAQPAPAPLDADLVACARRMQADLWRRAEILRELEQHERELADGQAPWRRALARARRKGLRALRKRGWCLPR